MPGPALPAAALAGLADAVGVGHVVTDPDVTAGHSVDWTGRFRGSTPAVVRPGSRADVVGLVAAARAHRIPLVTQGGNTGLVGGSVPLGGEVVVHTGRLRAIREVDAEQGTLVAEAGVTIAEVRAAAAEAGWEYGVDWAARDTATVGGSIATNAGGIHVVRHGPTRAQIRGVEAVWGDGRVLDDLDRLEKDATGYDLSGLLCGSEGTLGIVTAARLRLVPARPHRVTAALGLVDLATAVRVAGRLRRALPDLVALEAYGAAEAVLVADHLDVPPVIDPVPPITLLVEVAATVDPTDGLASAVADLGPLVTDDGTVVAVDGPRQRDLWRHREGLTEAISTLGPPHKLDVSLPAGAIAPFVDEVRAALAAHRPELRCWVFGHLGDGNVHVNVTGAGPDDTTIDDTVLGLVLDHGGSVSAEHGVGVAKGRWATRQRGADEVATLAAVRAAVDPDGILNPAVLPRVPGSPSGRTG